MGRLRSALVVVAVASTLLSGCGLTVPADPHGTLDQVSGGVLRVGVSHNPPSTDTGQNRPVGTDVELIRDFAAEVDAEVEWTKGGEEVLVNALERGALDVVIGGITDETPWVEKAAITQPFAEVKNDQGERENHVMLVRMGENGFLVELETFLLGRKDAQ